MSPIADVATHLVEKRQQLSVEIINDILQNIEVQYPQAEIDRAVYDFHRLIGFLGESLISDGGEIDAGLVAWSRKLGERDANEGKKITDSLKVYPVIRETFIDHIARISMDYQLPVDEIVFVTKRINYVLDLSINETIKAFDYFKDKIIKATQEEVSELSAPVVPIHKGIAVLPLIGAIDSYRAKYILEKVIPKVAELKVECLIIDFSGIQTIDTMVTNHIFKIYDVLRLLGIHATLTGIRPDLAQTAVAIGIDFSSLKAYATVQQALEAIQRA
ncbi:STAS domain-containing protein [Aneurinibacillus tyrosinisolvens]|uniref:STAS domain-containing protein n=1 Tax=Aneurinibacillus tyrosinisolvens TaxID=1443435 RepID=UPI00063F3B04|nr:STAS domain-containing protein [Aneurinibacillus tyrosinisolvens]